MATTRYKVRFRYVWTVYYDLSTNGSVESVNYNKKELGVKALRSSIAQWMRSDTMMSASDREEIQALLDLRTEQSAVDAAEMWNDIQNERSNGTNADRLWLERTRLVLSRKKVTP